MSAVYRIDVEHRPAEPSFKWIASIHRISDGYYLTSELGETEQAAVSSAYKWIAAQNEQYEPYTLFADEDGKPVPGSVSAG